MGPCLSSRHTVALHKHGGAMALHSSQGWFYTLLQKKSQSESKVGMCQVDETEVSHAVG